MTYLTFDNLTNQSFIKAETFNLSLSSRTYVEKMVFLSYRREDKQWVAGIVRFLKSLGISVYVDYLDETLEDKASDAVAMTLRSRISKCSKFICLATSNSSKSKWMPWELGLGDRIVNYLNVAMLPLTNDPNQWGDQEYGNIYGKVTSNYSYSVSDSNDWYLTYPNGNKVKLKDWLNN
ncbi:toll/interleukin-1 receptor domain-containing protein [Mucilaginibacter sp.]|uniref:toll/interleukin-1 receptor domain-containing protein n=1 Tax=Mucilaginibacter sp. TaxID=1882438 RepID=UPI0025D17AEA|nr:toll/interleukin-1 receptor domain-containing protein [Mucilaginibacter sp.]